MSLLTLRAIHLLLVTLITVTMMTLSQSTNWSQIMAKK